MNKSEDKINTATEHPSGEQFSDLIRSILDLPVSDQQRLHTMLSAVLGVGYEVPIAGHAAVGGELNGDEEVDEYREVESWLASINAEAPVKQIQLIDEMNLQVEYQSSLDLLSVHRGKLLDSHPPLAVRGAVTRLATESPIQLVLGVLGLGVGVVSVGLWVFHRIF